MTCGPTVVIQCRFFQLFQSHVPLIFFNPNIYCSPGLANVHAPKVQGTLYTPGTFIPREYFTDLINYFIFVKVYETVFVLLHWKNQHWLTTIGPRHQIQFSKAEVLFKSSSWNVRLIRESLEIALTQGGINKRDGAKLSNAWLPVHTIMTS